jgi:hypothetical protein
MKSLEALTILEERRQEFLFCNYDESGHQLMEDAPLPLNKAEKIIDMIASLLNIPRNIISLKSFRKGRAIEDFLTALYNYKENVTLKYILSVLKSNELWKSEACMNYLVYGDKIIYQTFDLFRSLRERDPSATPQGCHKFLTDFITQSYFSGEDKLVCLIYDNFVQEWNDAPSKDFEINRKNQIANQLNTFLFTRADSKSSQIVNPEMDLWHNFTHIHFHFRKWKILILQNVQFVMKLLHFEHYLPTFTNSMRMTKFHVIVVQ